HAAHLCLVGSSLLASSQMSDEFLQTHEINILFRHRDAFKPLPIEETMLTRTVLADRSEVKPGWYWFPQDQDSQLIAVAYRAFFDGDPAVMRGALTLLTRARARRNEWTTVLVDAATTPSHPKDVQDLVWAYLEAVITAADRTWLEPTLGNSTVPKEQM